MPRRRPAAPADDQLIDRLNQSAATILHEANQLTETTKDLRTNRRVHPNLTRKASLARSTCLTLWKIDLAEFDEFFSQNLTSEKALRKLVSLANKVDWVRAKALLLEGQQQRLSVQKPGLNRNPGTWTSYEVDFALSQVVHDPPLLEAPPQALEHGRAFDEEVVEEDSLLRPNTPALDIAEMHADVSSPPGPQSPALRSPDLHSPVFNPRDQHSPVMSRPHEDASILPPSTHEDDPILPPSTHEDDPILAPSSPFRLDPVRHSSPSRPPHCNKRKREYLIPSDLFALDGWLSANTLMKLLNLVTAGQAFSTYVADPSLVVRPRSPFISRLCSLSLRTVLVPLHIRNHWAIASISTQATEISFFDSMSEPAHKKGAQALLQDFLKGVRQAVDAHEGDDLPPRGSRNEWYTKFEPLNLLEVHCPPQMNGDDCGIAVVVSALHTVTRAQLPRETHYGVWRDALCCLSIDVSAPAESTPAESTRRQCESARLFTRHWSRFSGDVQQMPIKLPAYPSAIPGPETTRQNAESLVRAYSAFVRDVQVKLTEEEQQRKDVLRTHMASMVHIRDMLLWLRRQVDPVDHETDVFQAVRLLADRNALLLDLESKRGSGVITQIEGDIITRSMAKETARLVDIKSNAGDALVRLERTLGIINEHIETLAKV